MRWLLAVAMMAVALWAPAVAAQDAAPWQASIDGQIEALRAEDGDAALTFASAGFRTQFEGQGRAFLLAVVSTGYTPIIQSRSHSFGESETGTGGAVLQQVELTGRDGRLYRAVYRMVDEPDEGWRVEGVVLQAIEGIGI